MQNEYEIKKEMCEEEFTTVEWLQLMTETFL